jgi:hypothetical protein
VVGDQAQCTTSAQVCGNDDLCHACLVDGNVNCTPGATCVNGNTCVAPQDIAFAAPTAAPGQLCTMDDPCTLSEALQKVATSSIQTIQLVSSSAPYSDGPYTISGSTTVTITPAPGLPGVPAISSNTGPIFSISTSGKVEIDSVVITGSNDDGVKCRSGSLVLSQDEISSQHKYGVDSSGCTIDVDRSRIHGNDTGGLYFNDSNIDVYDNFVYDNGTDNTQHGAVDVEGQTNGKLQFNTISYNDAKQAESKGQQDGIGGLNCQNIGQVDARSSIISGNTGTQYLYIKVLGVSNCDLSPTYTSDDDAIHFVMSDSPYDLHLTSRTPNQTIVDNPSACTGDVTIDIDGEQRPKGPYCDLGADEY